MKPSTIALLLGIFVPSMVCLTVLCVHGAVPGTAITTLVTAALMGAFGLSEPGSAGKVLGGLLPGAAGTSTAVQIIEKELPKL